MANRAESLGLQQFDKAEMIRTYSTKMSRPYYDQLASKSAPHYVHSIA